MSRSPEDMVVSRHGRLVDGKLSEAHLTAAIEERAKRLAELRRMPGANAMLNQARAAVRAGYVAVPYPHTLDYEHYPAVRLGTRHGQMPILRARVPDR